MELATVEAINEACRVYAYGGGYHGKPVYCQVPGEGRAIRIVEARELGGRLQAKEIRSGRWLEPTRVYC